MDNENGNLTCNYDCNCNLCETIRSLVAKGIEESQSFAVNILRADQQTTSNEFAGGASQQERFESTSWTVSASGSPFLNDSIVSLDCKLVNKVLVGTHWIMIGEIQDSISREGEPLLYFSGAYRGIGEL